MAVVTVYTPPALCTACNSTKLRLKQKKIDFETVEANDETIARFKDEGHNSFPVVIVDFDDGATWSWAGFHFDYISELAELLQAA